MSDGDDAAARLDEVRTTLAARLQEQHRQLYGRARPEWWEYLTRRHWDETTQRYRLDDLLRHGLRPPHSRILEVGAGCGPFVSLALQQGHDCWGTEADAWRIEVFRQKNRLLRRPAGWGNRIVAALQEDLPFADGTFDGVISAQALEHAHDPMRALHEMIRVTRPGGGVHVRCPDYRGTFEPHYRLPWVPLCPRPMAHLYLRMLRRPARGLSTLRYVTRPRILTWLRVAERRGRRMVVTDEHQVTLENGLRRRRLPNAPGAFVGWRLATYLASLGRRELAVSLFIRILE